MFKNYLNTALRFLKQNKVFAGINVLGLSIALAASFIILLYVINELSYDNCHKNRKQVYRVINYYSDFKITQAGTPYILATALKEEFPQVEKAVRTRTMRGFKIKLKDEFVSVNSVATDSEVFDIFTLPIISGTNDGHLLDDLNSIALSRELAEMFFPGQDAVGKEMLALVNDKEEILTVSAVFENIPVNSTFRAKCFINSKWTIETINKGFNITNAEKSWTHDFWITWVKLAQNSDPGMVDKQFKAFEIKHISAKPDRHYSLQNLSDIYLGSSKVQSVGIQGNVKNIKLFSAIAFLILLVATINYIILSTAVSTGRAREIGIRKTSGADGNSIKKQLLGESVLITMLVLPIALFLAWLALPYAGELFQTKLQIIGSNIFIYIIVYLCLSLLIGVVSGIYTSAYLSRLKVIDILKNNLSSGKRKQYFRSSLIVIQLVIFCSFVAGTLVVRSQYQYSLSKDPGYYNKNILIVNLGRDFKGYSAYINTIKTNPNIIMAGGAMNGLPMDGSMSSMVNHFQNKEEKIQVEGLGVDYNFLETMGIELKEGRFFSEEFGSDMTKSTILNETAVKQLGITDPIGKTIQGRTIIGVVKDFNLHSIRTDIPPLSIDMTDLFIDQVSIRYKPGTINSILPMLEAEWKKAAPDRQFRYSTIENITKEIYSSEKNLSTIVSIFALFTLLISAFGLFGLTLFFARSRTKEIGIKKVFGSSVQLIVYSFLKGNIILVLLSALLSIPVTTFVMLRWLSNFSYHTNISWWVFAVAFAVAIIVVLSTVLFHSYRASRINPVEALRYE